VPRLLVPDNTKLAVIKACLYEPQVNRSYAEMAAHYDTAILPARPRRPRDKACPVEERGRRSKPRC
jgi:transposase